MIESEFKEFKKSLTGHAVGFSITVIICGSLLIYYINTCEISPSLYNELDGVTTLNDLSIMTRVRNKSYIELRDLIEKCSEDNVITYNEHHTIMSVHMDLKAGVYKDRFIYNVKREN